jgi:hypothetical protein
LDKDQNREEICKTICSNVQLEHLLFLKFFKVDPWIFSVSARRFFFIFSEDSQEKQVNYPNQKHKVNVDEQNIFVVSIHNNLLLY